MASQQTHADRIARSLKRLGFQLSRTGRTFKIIDDGGEHAINSKPAMTLAEIESWIGEYVKPGSGGHHARHYTSHYRDLGADLSRRHRGPAARQGDARLSTIAELSTALQVAITAAERQAARRH